MQPLKNPRDSSQRQAEAIGRSEPPPSSFSYLKGARILIAEDSKDNQTLIKLFLIRHGVVMTFVDHGEDAVREALNGSFDLVLMDIQMPVMDGRTATHTLRAQGYLKPIIALTAHAMREDRDLCLNSGFTDYLTKPIDAKVLASTIQKILQASTSAIRPSLEIQS